MPLFAIVVTALFSVANYEPRLRLAVAGGVVLALGGSADIVVYGPGGADDAYWMWRVPEFALAWAVGRAFYQRRRHAEDLERRADELVRTQDARMAAAVAEERNRIARELHDVVAHSVGVMVVQAGAAEQALGPEPAAVAGSLRNIQEVGRQSVVELRRLLGVLKTSDPEAITAPQPSLENVAELAAKTAAAGLDVEVKVEGQRPRLPTSVDVSAYRIVQEGLTNALKHAAATRAVVHVRYAHDRVEVAVVDNGKGMRDNSQAAGNGLVGVRERAALFGGTFRASNRPAGGFELCAVLPFGYDSE